MNSNAYYLWKWADNDLPGQPNEVFSELLRGKMHPAVQPFDARPMLQELQETAATRHALGEEWNWQVQPADSPDRAHFIFLRCPESPQYGSWFDKIVFEHGLSGYDEQSDKLIKCLVAKLNEFSFGESPDELYDIVADDLPVLLGRLSPEQADPWARLNLNNRAAPYNVYVQCYAHPDGFDVEWGGFDVEWLKNHRRDDLTGYDHWRAGYEQHRNAESRPLVHHEERVFSGESRTVKLQEFQHEKLRFSDVLCIFQAFLRGKPRPSRYHWRSIKEELQ